MRISEVWGARRQEAQLGAHELEPNRVLALPGGPDVTVHVEHGRVVVTRAGDLEDHVLEAGATMSLAGYGRAVAWALQASRIAVRRLPERAALPTETALAR